MVSMLPGTMAPHTQRPTGHGISFKTGERGVWGTKRGRIGPTYQSVRISGCYNQFVAVLMPYQNTTPLCYRLHTRLIVG